MTGRVGLSSLLLRSGCLGARLARRDPMVDLERMLLSSSNPVGFIVFVR